MSKLTIHEKVDRVMRLLLALRRRGVAAALAMHGFSAKDIAEGFRLLQSLTVSDVSGAGNVIDPSERREKIDAWAQRWFPIVQAALARRHPEVLARLFPKLPSAAKAAVHLDGEAMLFRLAYDDIDAGNAALKLLSERGLTKAVIDELRALLDSTMTSAASGVWPPQDFAGAEERLWEWYLEWSAIVRARVKDKRVLREMGFTSGGGHEATE